MHVSALIVALVTGCRAPGLNTTYQFYSYPLLSQLPRTGVNCFKRIDLSLQLDTINMTPLTTCDGAVTNNLVHNVTNWM